MYMILAKLRGSINGMLFNILRSAAQITLPRGLEQLMFPVHAYIAN